MFFGNKHERILNWREFRKQLNNWPADIDTLAQTWAKAPITNNYLVYDDTKSWPDPWMLIYEGIFCDISIALGIFYTLYYSTYSKKESMKIEHYQLKEKHQTLNLVNLEDGKYMLNYHTGRAVNINMLEQLPRPTYTVTAADLPIKD